MKSRYIYTILIVFAAFAFVFTGCTNGLTQKLDKKNDSSKIVVEGSIKLPSAIPSAVRSAYTSYTDYYNSTENQTSQVIMEVSATATINGTNQEETQPIQNNTFTLYLPKEDADWTFEVKCCDGSTNQILMSNTTTKTIQASESYVSLDPFVLTYTPDTIGNGQINLPFKATDSSITKLKFELKDGDVEIFTGQFREFYNSLAYLDIGTDVSVPQGTYDLYISFVDADGMIYGPVVETISVVTNFTTDTWFGSDSFIKQTTGEYNIPITAFVVPSAADLKAMFPNYTYSEAVTSDVAIMWDYDPDTYKPTYTVHPVDSGNVSDVGYPLARGKDIRDVFPDYTRKDMYVLTNENALYKYTASSGYSEYKVNYEQDFYILTACANNGTAYALCFDFAAQYMNPVERYILYKFDDTDNYMTEIGYVPLPYANYPQLTDSFKITLCDNYLFVAYNSIKYGYEQGFSCAAFDVTIKNGNALKTYWLEGEEFDLKYNSINGFNNTLFNVNDIVAVYNGEAYDIYALLGYEDIGDRGRPFGSYGGIIKIKTVEEGDSYKPEFDSSYDYRYLYKVTDPDSLYCNNSEQNFYNPIKFIGKTSDNYLIADDGAEIITEYNDKEKIYIISEVNPVNRVVSVDITATSAGTLSTKTVNDDFDWYTSENKFINYKVESANGQQMSSANTFVNIPGNDPTIVLGTGLNFELFTIDPYGNTQNTNQLPGKKGEQVYIKTTPEIPGATYDIVLYCNGKDLNKDSDGNLLPEQDRYYKVYPELGSLEVCKPLPFMGYEYNLAVDVINQFMVDGELTIIHNDAILNVCPAIDFELNSSTWEKFNNAQELIAGLDEYLFADYVIFKISASSGTKFPLTEFISTISSYFVDHPCDHLVLDYSLTEGLTEVTAGMFGVDCAKIIMPVKRKSYTVVPETICTGAFISLDQTVCFKGDLVLHKSIKTIQSGVFGAALRSITIDKSNYSWDGTTNYSATYSMKNIDKTDGEYILAEYTNTAYRRIIACTKRDEPFELDLAIWSSVTTIDDNAFKGLPVTCLKLNGKTIDYANAFDPDIKVED